MFPENFALYTSQKQVDLRDFEQCLYQVKKKTALSSCCSFQGYIHENSDNFQGCNCSVYSGTPLYGHPLNTSPRI